MPPKRRAAKAKTAAASKRKAPAAKNGSYTWELSFLIRSFAPHLAPASKRAKKQVEEEEEEIEEEEEEEEQEEAKAEVWWIEIIYCKSQFDCRKKLHRNPTLSNNCVKLMHIKPKQKYTVQIKISLVQLLIK